MIIVWNSNDTTAFVEQCGFFRLTADYKDRHTIFAVMDVTAALQNLTASLSFDERLSIKKELSIYLNHLLLNDFSALVQLLYTVDVSEEKLRSVLQENKQADAGDLLAELILERQLQKGTLRSELPQDDIPDEERW